MAVDRVVVMSRAKCRGRADRCVCVGVELQHADRSVWVITITEATRHGVEGLSRVIEGSGQQVGRVHVHGLALVVSMSPHLVHGGFLHVGDGHLGQFGDTAPPTLPGFARYDVFHTEVEGFVLEVAVLLSLFSLNSAMEEEQNDNGKCDWNAVYVSVSVSISTQHHERLTLQ